MFVYDVWRSKSNIIALRAFESKMGVFLTNKTINHSKFLSAERQTEKGKKDNNNKISKDINAAREMLR